MISNIVTVCVGLLFLLWLSFGVINEDGLSCRRGNGRSARHHSLNDLVWRAIAKADIPALKEPSGLLRTDGKRPDSVKLLPWKQGKCVTWDVTVSDALDQS